MSVCKKGLTQVFTLTLYTLYFNILLVIKVRPFYSVIISSIHMIHLSNICTYSLK